MSSNILHPPAHLSPSVALQLSQQAPIILKDTPSSISPFSIKSLYAASESVELWTSYENLMLSCLRTGDDESALLCLERLTVRFGTANERLMALHGLYQEATAENDAALQKVLEKYDAIIAEDPSNMPVTKRRIALQKSLGKVSEAIQSLNRLLDASPTDAESWAEVAELYISQGLYHQGIFALEEALLIAPNAWNMHARLGEVQYIAATAGGGSSEAVTASLAESLRRFCRSIELCDDYLRGYYGLKITSGRILSMASQNTRQSKSEEDMPDLKTLQLLNQKATSKLTEIVRRSTGGESGWQGYDAAELIAARELLDRDSTPVTR